MKHKEKRKHLESEYFLKTARISRGYEDAVPQSFVEAPGCTQAAGENTSSSDYYTCVTSPYKLLHHGYRNTQQNTPCPESHFSDMSRNIRTTPQDSNTSISSHSASNKDPIMSLVHGTDRRLMKIYYMHVQMKRGVAVLCETEEGWEPPSKKTKIEEMTYIKEVQKNVPLSHMPGKNLPIFPEPSVDSRAQGERKKADCSARPPHLVVYRRAPLCKVLHRGFRCMACCHVFSNLELLKEHVENGIREGFSCHVFHRAMA
uniref:Family with sequence similarity 170 member A n=1 Tax=Myotis lucifugus TaxID=59463 RepID=G1QE28_MYOLU